MVVVGKAIASVSPPNVWERLAPWRVRPMRAVTAAAGPRAGTTRSTKAARTAVWPAGFNLTI